ncbi:cilia- and flagella-associated protein 251 isoform X2 [Megalobrama amblycephala]|uniref:cilia- and flagella-associated protein 251 isoform X2 n=1 Tax=Megalobrama amblycephala TaxID=75352 RepID=UPI0020143CC2|nr:cilia- and flagella-associated protein 251 isoform X2 [Megalobrama amblycephala]
MSTANETSDKTDAETEGAREQKSAVDNHMKKELDDEDEGVRGAELSSLREDVEESQVYTATSLTVIPKEPRTKTHPLVLDWAYGINQTLPVFSLQDEDKLVILYICAHVAVIYDHTSNAQHLLQGHCSPITCLCASEDRRWLVTADMGRESLVIIWDAYTGIPVRTLFDCHPEGGVSALALSKDSKYLATVGAGTVQRVCIWDWTDESDSPKCQVDLSPKYGCQERHLEYSAPEITDKTFNMVLGSLSQSIFHYDSVQALTATSAGNIVLWDKQTESVSCQPIVRKAIKLVPLQKEAITVLTLIDSFIVTGDVNGHIKFYDGNLKLINLYNELSLDPIKSISFSKEKPSTSSLGYPKDCTLDAKPFVMRNVVLSTTCATVVHVNAQRNVLQTLLKEHAEPLEAVACHPKQPLVAMGSHSGTIKVWDYESKEVVCSRVFRPHKQIQCITYDPQGFYLAVGFASGALQIVDACTLQSDGKDCLQYSQDSITHLTFSQDSCYLAAADTGKGVTLLRQCKEGAQEIWKYQGRHHSHYKPIQDLLFGVDLDSNQPRLLSLGMDRRLVEYDLQNSGENELLILSSDRIEQSAVPTSMVWYPPLTPENFLLTASNLYKMKLFNATSKMCRKTLFGPSYGSPVKKMAILPASKDGDPDSRYMAYITQDKVGIQILPLDGNPHKSFAMICHSTGVSTLACSYDGRYVFTAGGQDCTVFSWELNLSSLEASAGLGGKDMLPFYDLLEGGRDGQFFREMEEYFYYCQLQNQDLNTMETRLVSTRIPLADVPFLMRALGFYPTEQELEDMQNEVKFSRYAETRNYVMDIDLEEFIKLYINHRPASGISGQELCNAFQVLGKADEEGRYTIDRDELLELLQARGEHMTEDDLAECFTTLLGISAEGSSCTESLLESVLPPKITMGTFATDVLGFSAATQEFDQEHSHDL